MKGKKRNMGENEKKEGKYTVHVTTGLQILVFTCFGKRSGLWRKGSLKTLRMRLR